MPPPFCSSDALRLLFRVRYLATCCSEARAEGKWGAAQCNIRRSAGMHSRRETERARGGGVAFHKPNKRRLKWRQRWIWNFYFRKMLLLFVSRRMDTTALRGYCGGSHGNGVTPVLNPRLGKTAPYRRYNIFSFCLGVLSSTPWFPTT